MSGTLGFSPGLYGLAKRSSDGVLVNASLIPDPCHCREFHGAVACGAISMHASGSFVLTSLAAETNNRLLRGDLRFCPFTDHEIDALASPGAGKEPSEKRGGHCCVPMKRAVLGGHIVLRQSHLLQAHSVIMLAFGAHELPIRFCAWCRQPTWVTAIDLSVA